MTVQPSLFDPPPHVDPLSAAAKRSKSEQMRLDILVFLAGSSRPLTMFCPFVLSGKLMMYKQTACGPRFPSLLADGLIEGVEPCQPLLGAESIRVVSAFAITEAGREYLRRSA